MKEKTIQVNYVELDTILIIELAGELCIGNIQELRLIFEAILETERTKIGLDLKDVKSVDSSTLRLLINMFKKMKDKGGELYIYSLQDRVDEVFMSANLEQVMNIYKTEDEFKQAFGDFKQKDSEEKKEQPEEDEFSVFMRKSFPGDGIKEVPLSCYACGHSGFNGFHLDSKFKYMSWKNNRYIPSIELDYKEHTVNFIRLEPVLCPECAFASLDLRDFNIKGSYGNWKSKLDNEDKSILLKNHKKRSAYLAEQERIVTETFWDHPRDNKVVCCAYELIMGCAQAIGIEGTKSNPFLVGYCDIVMHHFIEYGKKKECAERASAWFYKASENIEYYPGEQHAKIYYYDLVGVLLNNKLEEAKRIYNKIKQLNEQEGLDEESIFYSERADEIWKKFITEASSELSI